MKRPVIAILLLFFLLTTGLVFVFVNQQQSLNDIRSSALYAGDTCDPAVGPDGGCGGTLGCSCTSTGCHCAGTGGQNPCYHTICPVNYSCVGSGTGAYCVQNTTTTPPGGGNTPTPSRTPTPTPTPVLSTANIVCQSYNASTGTTPVRITWTNGTGLQVWDSTDFWWWNAHATSPITISSVDNAGVTAGIPSGRTVYARTTYDFITFSTTTSTICPPPSPTPTNTPTVTPTRTPTPTNTPTRTPTPTPTSTLTPTPSLTPSLTPTSTPTPTPIIAQCDDIKIYKDGIVVVPNTLSPGDSIVIAVTGGNATKARVRINGEMTNGLIGWTETEDKNAAGEYIFSYTIPSDFTSMTIESEIFGLDGLWH